MLHAAVKSAPDPLQNIMKKGCNVGWTASAPVLIQMVVLSLQRSLFTRSLSASNSIKSNLRRTSSLKSSTTEMNRGSLDYFGLTAVNSFLKYLNAESSEGKQQHSPRQIYKSHFTSVLPEPVPTPYMIIGSRSCAQSLGLDPAELRTLKFVKAFSGNVLMPGLDTPYCSNYGCHCYSSWFGQLGDGRAMALGEVAGETGDHYELQLKGCGRSPYSRGFDGRAVLRSSIREFLVSEAMFHLGVKTTRALSVVGTGQEIKRPWYAANSKEMMESGGSKRSRHPPNVMISEPGAILCRVSKSFLRFAQLELFAIREEYEELVQLTNHVCLREFPHLLSTPELSIQSTQQAIETFSKEDLQIAGPPQRYVDLFRGVAENNAALVADWQRVGYTQGNMNSDNTLLGGRTIDYGPFGWMEKYDPMYQPFTSDSDGKFAFIRQPNAMGVNVAVLAETVFVPLIRHCCTDPAGPEAEAHIQEIKAIVSKGYAQAFWTAYREIIRKKLGFKVVEENSPNMKLWTDLERLMAVSKVDFTIFFRLLSDAASQSDNSDALAVLEPSFYEPIYTKQSAKGTAASLVVEITDIAAEPDRVIGARSTVEEFDIDSWRSWLDRYLAVIKAENRDTQERIEEQNRTNPKYVLRNWMAILAYEKAADGDYSVVTELSDLLCDPYDLSESTEAVAKKWFVKTPYWAQSMPGAEFMSCSS